MKMVKIRFEKIGINKIDIGHSMVNLAYTYWVDTKPNTIVKNFDLEKDGVINFTKQLMSELKKGVKTKIQVNQDELLNTVTVTFDEREPGETEEKLIKTLERIRSEIKNFRRIKSSDNYFNAFQRINGMVLSVK